MRLVKIFFVVALVAMSAAAVKAGSINNNDPKFTVTKPGGGIAELQSFGKSAGLDPMVALVYNGNAPLYMFTVTEVPSNKTEQWSNFSNIFNGFSSYGITGGLVVTFSGKNPPGPCDDQVGQGLPNIGCPGVITKGETIDVSVIFSNSKQTGTVSVPLSFSCVGGGQMCSDGGLTVDANEPNVATPEPSTMLLFLSLGPAIGFAKRRWDARQSA
jgi:hypothetical protein